MKSIVAIMLLAASIAMAINAGPSESDRLQQDAAEKQAVVDRNVNSGDPSRSLF